MSAVLPPTELDGRELVPRGRHQLIFRLLDRLEPGASLRLINDHDPIPLYSQLEATRPGRFGWEYREQGPLVWSVDIINKGAGDLDGQTIAAIVERHPETMPVFAGFGIDLCCGGGLTIGQAASAHGLAPHAILSAVQARLGRK
ncbi:MAG TPA: DUF542 domain-containing protein [Herpetosiphonaceae bacterium]|nr:DUF542 domain-containing protein [Herpetosiphonaceae bacterium]